MLTHFRQAFTYLVYRPADRQRTTKIGAALLDVMDFRDWWRGMRDSSRYIVARSRGRDFTEVDDIRRQKYVHLHKALGRERHAELVRERQAMKQQARSFFKDGGAREEAFDVEHAADAEKSVSGRGAPSSDGKTQSSASAGLLRPVRTVGESFEDDTLSPRGNRALGKRYDDDDDDEEAGDAALVESRGLIRALTYTRAQQPDEDSVRYEDEIDHHPELSRYHNPALQSPEIDEKGFAEVVDDELVLNGNWVPVEDAAERQRHAPRQGSGSIGAWWRSVRERISGSGADHDDEHDAFGGGYSAPSRAVPHEDDAAGALPSTPVARIAAFSQKKQTSSSSADSVLRSSPLDNIISTCRTSSHDSDVVSPSSAAADAPRPPLLHSVSAGQGVLGAAFSRVSSMRTTEPPSEQHADEVIVTRGAVTHEQGVSSQAMTVVKSEQGHISTTTSAVRDDGVDAGAAPRAPSPTASSAVGPLPKGMLFSDPLSPTYAERAAARPAPPVSAPRPAKRTKTAPAKPASAPTAQSGGTIAPHRRESTVDAQQSNKQQKQQEVEKTRRLENAPASRRMENTPSSRHLENTPSSREAEAWRQRQQTEQQLQQQQQQQPRAKVEHEQRPELAVLVPADFSSLRSPPPGFAAESGPQLVAPKAQRASLFAMPNSIEQSSAQPPAPPTVKQATYAPRASLPPTARQGAPATEQVLRQEPQRSVSQPSVAPVVTARSQPPPLPRTTSAISAKEAAATASGPKGRKIKLSRPGPLSPETFPYGAQDQVATPTPTSPPATGGSAIRQSRIAFAADPRAQAAAPASRVAPSTTGSGRVKTAEEREREYLGLPAPPGSKGRVVNGGRSQAQEDAAREAAARAREDAERVKRFEAWRAEKEQHERAAREKEAKARATAEAERVRRSSIPAPGPSQIAAILPPVEMKWTWLGKKPKQPAPYTPLPAPSQLGADIGDERDAFTAGAAAREDMEQSAQAPPSHVRAGVGASRRASAPLHPGAQQQQSGFAVGSVAPRGAVMDPTRQQYPVVKPYPDAPGMPRPRTSAPAQPYPANAGMPQRHGDQPRQASERYWASNGYSSGGRHSAMQYPQQALQPSDFAPAPSNAVGSYTQRPAPRARASYDPYTGEPASFRGRPDPRGPRHSYQQPRAAQRPDAYTSLPSRGRVVSDPRAAPAPHREQRPRQELRDGFHFESY
jgi:hypothetical protein